jgi:hypothetical protein
MSRPWWWRWALTQRLWLSAPEWVKGVTYSVCYGWRRAERERQQRIREYWDQ